MLNSTRINEAGLNLFNLFQMYYLNYMNLQIQIEKTQLIGSQLELIMKAKYSRELLLAFMGSYVS